MTKRNTRQAAQARGVSAERRAAWWLRLKGYRILARGFRVNAGEIDLIARRGRVLAMIEVKLRDVVEEALDAITATQRRRIARAAEAYLQRHPACAGLSLRFDAIVITPRHLPRHIEGAWTNPAGY